MSRSILIPGADIQLWIIEDTRYGSWRIFFGRDEAEDEMRRTDKLWTGTIMNLVAI